MKTAEHIAEKLWEKHQNAFDDYKGEEAVTRFAFLAALKEYGEAVRQNAASVSRGMKILRPMSEYQQGRKDGLSSAAAAIERMELP